MCELYDTLIDTLEGEEIDFFLVSECRCRGDEYRYHDLGGALSLLDALGGAGGILAADALVRCAPGADVDERVTIALKELREIDGITFSVCWATADRTVRLEHSADVDDGHAIEALIAAMRELVGMIV